MVYIHPSYAHKWTSLKDRMQYFATCIIYKEHSWEEFKGFFIKKLETEAVIQFIWNHEAT